MACKGKVAVALSGGVDSSVVAALLLREGWEVIGATLNFHTAGFGDQGIVGQAAQAARQLGIEHSVIDCVDEFERLVLRPTWDSYLSGRTPNPCLMCNEKMKFGVLLDWALENGCSALATGHYAIIQRDGDSAALLRGACRNKDQSYFLAGLVQEQISRLIFPLGGMDKPAVRKIAAEMDLRSAKNKESQDTCFRVPGLSLQESLRAKFAGAMSEPKCGYIVGRDGKRLARHDGIHTFTIGQRRGVGVGTGAKAWVLGLDTASGDVCLTNQEEDLLCDEITVSKLSWTSHEPLVMPLSCDVQVRYRSAPVAATLLDVSDGIGRVALHSPVRAVAPGQSAAFYSGDRVLGRGTIEGRGHSN